MEADLRWLTDGGSGSSGAGGSGSWKQPASNPDAAPCCCDSCRTRSRTVPVGVRFCSHMARDQLRFSFSCLRPHPGNRLYQIVHGQILIGAPDQRCHTSTVWCPRMATGVADPSVCVAASRMPRCTLPLPTVDTERADCCDSGAGGAAGRGTSTGDAAGSSRPPGH